MRPEDIALEVLERIELGREEPVHERLVAGGVAIRVAIREQEQVADHLDRIADGDPTPFEALYRLTASRLWGVVRRMVVLVWPRVWS